MNITIRDQRLLYFNGFIYLAIFGFIYSPGSAARPFRTFEFFTL
jgi:hypothetical protein